MPFFSVVIPTYNRRNRLYQTILSVLNQSFADFEILVMDDGSTDGTQTMIEDLCDPRIVYSWESNSGGPATPRNRGLLKSRAPWICFLDADDIWLPEKLKCIWVEIQGNPDVDVFCHCEMLKFSNNSKNRVLVHGPYEDDFYKVLLQEGNRLSTSAVAVRRELITNNGLYFEVDSSYCIVEDYDFWLHLARCRAKFKFIPKILGFYIIENDNISLATNNLKSNLKTVLRNHVYLHQQFCVNKDKLWRKVEARVEFDFRADRFLETPNLGSFVYFVGFILQNLVSCIGIILDRLKVRQKKRYLNVR